MVKQVSQAISEHLDILSVAKGILVSYIITIPCFLIFALILTNTDFPEKFITPAVVVTTIISILSAGSIVAGKLKRRGWLNGGIVGLVYMFVLYIVSGIVFRNFSIDSYVLTMAALGIIMGCIGGIIGINLNKPSRPRFNR